MNAGGKTLARWSGYMKDPFLARSDELIKDPTTIEEKMARFASKPTEADAATIARCQESMGKYREAIDHYGKAASLSGGKNGYNTEIFESSFSAWQDKTFTFDDLSASAKAYFQAEKDPGELLTPARMMAIAANESENPQAAAPFIKQAIEATEGSALEDVVKGRKRLLPDYAMIVLKDEKKAVAYKKESLPEGWMEQVDQLNNFAWWCFENKVNLKEAQELAEHGVEISPPGADKAMILDTLAEICNARGDCSEAVVIIQKAIQEDPGKESYKKQLKRFQDLLAKGGK
jgi:tetratricopeptide (TPR) repeat protein